MFLVLSKEKIQTYIVSVLTVAILIGIANINSVQMITTSTVDKKIPIYNVQTNEKKIAFTINCAWTNDDIDQILEVLENNNVKLTFFIVGDWIDRYPESVKKIYEKGHEIGCHSDTHPHVSRLSKEKNLEEIQKCVEKIEKITGNRTDLYRAPYGEYNNTVINTAEENGYYTIQWNIDTLDYNGKTGTEMWSRIKDKLDNGSIILSHNGTKYTAESLDMLIKNIKNEGYEITKVSELIYKDNYYINQNGTQIKE